jgi:hypothetical protein
MFRMIMSKLLPEVAHLATKHQLRPNMAGKGGLTSPRQSAFEFRVFWGAVLPLALGAYGKVISRAPAQGH